jgi:hypothetical protein
MGCLVCALVGGFLRCVALVCRYVGPHRSSCLPYGWLLIHLPVYAVQAASAAPSTGVA